MSQDFWKFMVHEFLLENYILWIRKINVFSTLGGFHKFEKSTISHKIYHLKKKQNIIPLIFKNFKIFQKISQSKNFWKSMSHDFLEFIVQDFLEFNVPRFFATLAYLNSLAQAGGGGAYYMIFHYQKHTVLNYYNAICRILLT